MRNFTATIGGRNVEAAGTLVYDEPEGALVVTLAGAEVEFRFAPGGGSEQNTARWEYKREGNGVVIHLGGFVHPHGSGVQIPDLFDAGERKLSMALFIEAMPSPEGTMRLINFTVF
jgi:hypothetical protein